MRRWIVVVTVYFFVSISIVATPLQAEESSQPKRVMVLPFDGTSGGKFASLTSSIRSMISTRLAAKASVSLVDYSLKADDIRALRDTDAGQTENESLFSRIGTDYVISGALYALQSGLQIQVVLTGGEYSSEPANFKALATNDENILEAIEELVQDIASIGLRVEGDTMKAPAIGTAEERGVAGFTTEHPEKRYKRGIYSGTIVSDKGAGGVKALGVRRSSTLPMMIVAMDTADLDGDGSIEIISGSRTKIEIYRFNETRFQKLAEFPLTAAHKIHAVNVADIDGDGIAEIFVSGNRGLRASSGIYNWSSGMGIRPLITDLDWYIRPLNRPGEGLILAGQRANTVLEDGFVSRGISQLEIQPGYTGITAGQKLPLPKNLRLFDFAWADLDGDNTQEIVAIDQREKILVFDANNSLIWVSEEDYGGSRNFFGPTSSELKALNAFQGGDEDDDEMDLETAYIPTKVAIADVDNDGRQDIILGKNKRQWSKWLRNTREYSGGAVACLSWDGSSLQEIWRTNKISGYIADYTFVKKQLPREAPLPSTGFELYVAQVPVRMILGFLMSEESKMMKYDIDTASLATE